MKIRRYLAVIIALSLCSSGLHGMQRIKDARDLCYPALVGGGLAVAAVVGQFLYQKCHNMYRNRYSITYDKREVKESEDVGASRIIFDNIKFKKGGDAFDLSGTIWEYNTNKAAVGNVIRSGLVDHVAPLVREGKSVIVKLSSTKTAHFIGKNHTEEEIMKSILDVLLRVENETYIKSVKA